MVASDAAMFSERTPSTNRPEKAALVSDAVGVSARDAPSEMLLAGVAVWPNIGSKVTVPGVALVLKMPPNSSTYALPARMSKAEIGVHRFAVHRFAFVDVVIAVNDAGGISLTSTLANVCLAMPRYLPARSAPGVCYPL